MNIDSKLLEMLKKLTVLYVDDDKVILDYVSMIVGRRTKKTLTAENGIQGLERLQENPEIDIILTDLNMPEMSGSEMLFEVRKNYPDIPVIAITAFEEGYDIRDFDAVIIKPFEPNDMINAIIDAMLLRQNK